ncbi:MAG TPA: MFS transporter [Verrucomicrobiae bacterium]|nr:MFS transporter [Verrucomicrobiae bacterium]
MTVADREMIDAVPARASRRALAAWCLYDWANSAFPTVVVTFVFAAYFTEGVAADRDSGTAMWANGQSLSAILIAILSPCLGAIADRTGRRKPWILGFSLLCILATAGLWFVRPDPGYAMLAIVLVVLGNLGFELGITFYNALLPELVAKEWIGRLSGWAWGIGYAGGLSCLILSLMIFVQADPPRFGLDPAAAEHVRAVAPFAAAWMLLFIWPLFAFVRDVPRRGPSLLKAVGEGLETLWHTLLRIRDYRDIARFLVANMIYIDGLNTLFSFGGIYAAGQFGMAIDEVLLFGILLNISAGLGAAGFAWLDDFLGAKPTILISLGALILLCSGILLVRDKTLFYALGIGIGIFLGPAQAASRSLMARLAPADMRGEFFGLFALSGRVTSFLGPLLVGWVTYLAASQRVGMAMILPFFIIGALILMSVDVRRAGGR